MARRKGLTNEAHQLAEDLARLKQSQDWLSWVEIPLGSMFQTGGRIPRADVITMAKSFVKPSLTIYEIKTSRSDFLGDMNEGKYRTYFPYCSQFFFAVPHGLVRKEEIPDDCGLIVKGDKGWHVVQAARRRECEWDVELLVKLLIRGYEDHQISWAQYDMLKNLEYKGLKEASYQHGIRIASDLADSEQYLKRAEELRLELTEALGSPFPRLIDGIWRLQADINQLLTKRKYAEEAVELSDLVLRLFQGTRFFADNVPHTLRAIAEKLDKKFAQEGG